MIDITELIDNFRKTIIAVAKGISFLELYKGSDEWDEITEHIYDCLVVRPVKKRYKYTIDREYECWKEEPKGKSLFIKVNPGTTVLSGEKKGSSTFEFQYKHINEIELSDELSFIEFGSPDIDADRDFVAGLNYATGISISGEIICARVEDCIFYIEK